MAEKRHTLEKRHSIGRNFMLTQHMIFYTGNVIGLKQQEPNAVAFSFSPFQKEA